MVPVAQFEAFKVYEDEDQFIPLARMRKPKPNDLSNVYKGTSEDKFVTKKEAAEMQRIKQDEMKAIAAKKLKNHLMSLEMNGETDQNENESEIAKSKNNKDLFFEMEEYRFEIYQYLREHEVSLLLLCSLI